MRNVSTSNSNLTIIDKIDQLPKLSCSPGKNLFLKSQLNLKGPFIVKKGYVPIIRKHTIGSYKVSGIIDSIPDFICLTKNNSQNKSILFNLTKISYLSKVNIYTNVFINFVYNNPNQTWLSNYNLTYAYTSFGSFSVNVYTLFGGNVLSEFNKFINVQRIQTLYPFRKIQMNLFEINCSFNSTTLIDCYLKINISNYANPYQPITIDYGDGIFESFTINPYCKILL